MSDHPALDTVVTQLVTQSRLLATALNFSLGCDAVVTVKQWAHRLRQVTVRQRYDTTTTNDVAEIVDLNLLSSTR